MDLRIALGIAGFLAVTLISVFISETIGANRDIAEIRARIAETRADLRALEKRMDRHQTALHPAVTGDSYGRGRMHR